MLQWNSGNKNKKIFVEGGPGAGILRFRLPECSLRTQILIQNQMQIQFRIWIRFRVGFGCGLLAVAVARLKRTERPLRGRWWWEASARWLRTTWPHYTIDSLALSRSRTTARTTGPGPQLIRAERKRADTKHRRPEGLTPVLPQCPAECPRTTESPFLNDWRWMSGGMIGILAVGLQRKEGGGKWGLSLKDMRDCYKKMFVARPKARPCRLRIAACRTSLPSAHSHVHWGKPSISRSRRRSKWRSKGRRWSSTISMGTGLQAKRKPTKWTEPSQAKPSQAETEAVQKRVPSPIASRKDTTTAPQAEQPAGKWSSSVRVFVFLWGGDHRLGVL